MRLIIAHKNTTCKTLVIVWIHLPNLENSHFDQVKVKERGTLERQNREEPRDVKAQCHLEHGTKNK